MTVTALTRPAPRGGNRLSPDSYPYAGPRYERRRSFGPDPERRDRHQRARFLRAARISLQRGELIPVLYAVLCELANHCNDTLLASAPGDDGRACSGWWRERTIHGWIYPLAHTNPGPSDDTGARTARRWMTTLAETGWVESVHRVKVVNGELRGTSNLWRLQIPDHLRAEVHRAEDAARAAPKRPRHAKGGPTPRAPQNRPRLAHPAEASASAQMANIERNEERRANPCPGCGGAGTVDSRKDPGRVERCSGCDGSGIRAGP